MGGALKQAGFNDIRFVDAMTNYISDAELAQIIQESSTGCGDGDGNYADDLPISNHPENREGYVSRRGNGDGRHSPHLHVPGGAGGSSLD